MIFDISKKPIVIVDGYGVQFQSVSDEAIAVSYHSDGCMFNGEIQVFDTCILRVGTAVIFRYKRNSWEADERIENGDEKLLDEGVYSFSGYKYK